MSQLEAEGTPPPRSLSRGTHSAAPSPTRTQLGDCPVSCPRPALLSTRRPLSALMIWLHERGRKGCGSRPRCATWIPLVTCRHQVPQLQPVERDPPSRAEHDVPSWGLTWRRDVAQGPLVWRAGILPWRVLSHPQTRGLGRPPHVFWNEQPPPLW